jgi:hypothetical protein
MDEPWLLSHVKEADRMRGHNDAPSVIEDLIQNGTISNRTAHKYRIRILTPSRTDATTGVTREENR